MMSEETRRLEDKIDGLGKAMEGGFMRLDKNVDRLFRRLDDQAELAHEHRIEALETWREQTSARGFRMVATLAGVVATTVAAVVATATKFILGKG